MVLDKPIDGYTMNEFIDSVEVVPLPHALVDNWHHEAQACTVVPGCWAHAIQEGRFLTNMEIRNALNELGDTVGILNYGASDFAHACVEHFMKLIANKMGGNCPTVPMKQSEANRTGEDNGR